MPLNFLMQPPSCLQIRLTVVDEGDVSIDTKTHPFSVHLPGEWKMMGIKMGDIKMKDASAGGADDAVQAFVPALFRLRDGGGVAKVASGKPPISKLVSGGVFVLDDGFRLLLCAARHSIHSSHRRRSADVSSFSYTPPW